MKDIDKLEAHFRAEAEKQASTPPEFIWDEIDKQLPKKKKKDRLLFWFFLGLSICTIAFFQKDAFISKGQNDLSQSKSLEPTEKRYADEIDNTDKISHNSTNYTENKTIQSSQSETSTTSQIVTSQKDFQQGTSLDNNYENKIVPSKSELETKAQRQLSSSTKVTDGSQNTLVESATKDSDKLVQNWNSVAQQSTLHSESNLNSNKATQENTLPQKNGLQNISESSISQLSLLAIAQLTIENRSIPNLSSDFLSRDIDEPKNNRFFFEISSLIGSHSTRIRGEESEALVFRRDTETNWYTWGVKARIGYQLPNNFYIKTGLDFIESRDRFRFQESTVQLVATPESLNTTRFFSIGDITYRQLNIPLGIGVEKTKGKYIYGIEGTALFNVNFRAEGKIQTGPSSISRVENSDLYKNSLGLGYSAALTFGTKLSDRNSLYFRPTYSRYVSTTNLDGTEVTSNLSQFYLEVAFRRDLN